MDWRLEGIRYQWKSSGQEHHCNYYNKKDATWNQVWIDNSGFSLVLKGNYKNGKMVLKSKLLNGKNGKYYNQITWTKNPDGTVTQVWDIFDEKNKKVQEAFKGIYKKIVKTLEK